jgi:hypothetical protein
VWSVRLHAGVWPGTHIRQNEKDDGMMKKDDGMMKKDK